MTKGYTILWILLLALVIYLHVFQSPGYEGQREEIRKHKRMYSK